MTAVEWYDSQLKEIDYKLQSGLINLTQCKVLMDEAKSQAKEMEKEQQKDYAFYKKYWEVRNVKKHELNKSE